MSCGVGRRRGSDPTLLWLWRRPETIAQIRSLAWKPPYAAGAALEKGKKTHTPHTHKMCNDFSSLTFNIIDDIFEFVSTIYLFFCLVGFGLHLWHVEILRPGIKPMLQQ